MSGQKATTRVAAYFQQAYDVMNRELFAGQLPDALVTLQRRRNARGYFAAERFADRSQPGVIVDEIAMNPDTFSDRTDKEIVSTLLHEMVHLWQQHFDKPSRNGYHNARWAEKMLEVGLQPVSHDQPGKMTGQRVSHTIIEGGPFDKLWPSMGLDDALFNDLWAGLEKPKAKGQNKTKYECQSCGAAAWGKPDLRIYCGDCDEQMMPA